MKKILILGAGFGGLETATGLAAATKGSHEITLIDRSDSFFVGLAKIDVLLGRRTEQEARTPYAALRAEGVRFVRDEITAIDLDARAVTTAGGSFGYDYLIVALGADLKPEATPGFVESGGYEFYSMAGAVRLRPLLDAFSAGTLVLGILGTPYKCPPAPYEVAYLLHEQLVERGVRDRVSLKLVIPSPRPVPSPSVSDALERLCAERSIELVRNTPITSIDATAKRVITAGGAIGYDLFVGIPVHVPPPVVKASRLGKAGYVPVSPQSLETEVPGVYAIGDVAKIPAGELAVAKAGAFAESAARTVVSDILRKEGLASELVRHDARGQCYFELGGGEVGRVDANFLGGPAPKMVFEGPDPSFRAEKLGFEATRLSRWFR